MTRFKILLALLGFALAAGGVTLNQRLLVWAALIALAGALAVRLWERRRLSGRENDPQQQ
jgi:hypothetical protein